MTKVVQWLTTGGALLATLALVLDVASFCSVWWSKTEGDVVIEVSLWLSVTTSSEKQTPTVHAGCTNACDQTMLGRAREVTNCKSWSDICGPADSLCDGPPLPTPLPTVVPLANTPAPAPTPWWGAPEVRDVEPRPPMPVAPLTPDPYAPRVPGSVTTTITTSVRTFLVDEFARPTTTQTTNPAFAVPTVRPPGCSAPSEEQLAIAPYTEWELNFVLAEEVQEILFFELREILYQLPPRFLQQRPRPSEQVRLLWETLVARSTNPNEWLGEYGSCPSVPAELLRAWFLMAEQADLLYVSRQRLRPRDVPSTAMIDYALRDAWDFQLQINAGATRCAGALCDIVIPTPAPTPLPTPTLRAVSALAPDAGAVQTRPEKEPAPGDVFTFLQCQRAELERETYHAGATPWEEAVAPCELRSMCQTVIAIRFSVGIAFLLGAIYAVPAVICFVGTRHAGAEATRFSPGCALYVTLGSSVSLTIAIALAVWKRVPGTAANGSGFICAIFGLISFLCSVGLAGLGKGMQDALDKQDHWNDSKPGMVSSAERVIRRDAEASCGFVEDKPPPSSPSMAWQEPSQDRLPALAWVPANPPSDSPTNLHIETEADSR